MGVQPHRDHPRNNEAIQQRVQELVSARTRTREILRILSEEGTPLSERTLRAIRKKLGIVLRVDKVKPPQPRPKPRPMDEAKACLALDQFIKCCQPILRNNLLPPKKDELENILCVAREKRREYRMRSSIQSLRIPVGDSEPTQTPLQDAQPA
ncbi:hypothetical protein N7462_008477 [Penicillium macrosclerotiorum]|uniref:uncharacterized protein n=1 Tax=Penicillium macrosclerotiorum TaxID=303699 RepID=UPI0025496BD1|nr:uncharacterized protein N7462_008477 [Penicillium macrosclerotiorum]KAJ5675580.1 hypothetical protein N7462_008477 [Penicillium macrosclerotiorum]